MSRTISNLWSPRQYSRIYDWASILEAWNRNLNMPQEVEIILTNLKEACNPDSTYEPPFEQFLTYLNNEQGAISWFLFEAITHRWMWSEPRLDYVKMLVDEIYNLDGYFPDFPGSPQKTQTIRAWLHENLGDEELDQINMMPPLIPFTPPRRNSTQARRDTMHEKPSEVCRNIWGGEKFASVEFRVTRNKDHTMDDRIRINKNNDGSSTYSVWHNDQESNIKTRATDMNEEQVMTFLSNTLRFLSIDESPFENLQVFIPNTPTILLTPGNLTSQTRQLIYDSVSATMENWPVIV
jgi:hypothetical protein